MPHPFSQALFQLLWPLVITNSAPGVINYLDLIYLIDILGWKFGFRTAPETVHFIIEFIKENVCFQSRMPYPFAQALFQLLRPLVITNSAPGMIY